MCTVSVRLTTESGSQWGSLPKLWPWLLIVGCNTSVVGRSSSIGEYTVSRKPSCVVSKSVMDQMTEKKYFIIGSITLVSLGVGLWSLFGGKRYESIRVVPLPLLVAELGKRLK